MWKKVNLNFALKKKNYNTFSCNEEQSETTMSSKLALILIVKLLILLKVWKFKWKVEWKKQKLNSELLVFILC